MVNLAKVEQQAPQLVSLLKTANSTWGGFPLLGQVPVLAAIDRSGSMDNYYRSGLVQRIVELALSAALVLDDDGEIPVAFFSDSTRPVGNANLDNCTGFVAEKTARLSYGTTDYVSALKWIASESPAKNSKPTAPALALFFTDGNPNSGTERAVEKALANLCEQPVFIQFIGIGNNNFSFLRKLDTMPGRTIDNAGFFEAGEANDAASIIRALAEEFPKYIKAARAQGLIQ